MSRRKRPAGRVVARIASWLLLLYPRSFRREAGADMLRDLERRAAERRGRGLPAFAFWLLGNAISLVGTAVGEWRDELSVARLLADLRVAARTLRRSPGFTSLAVLILGLGIGATTAIFSLVYGVVIRGLPYADAEQLVIVDHAAPKLGFDGGLGMVSGLFVHYRRFVHSLQGIAYWETYEVTVTGGGLEPERVRAVEPTSNLFTVLRVRPLYGRLLTPVDDDPDSDRTVLLSHAYWRSRFGGDPDAVGRDLEISGRSYRVVGVLDGDFHFPAADVYLDNRLDFDERFGAFNGRSVARMEPGASIATLRADLERELTRVDRTWPGSDVAGWLSQMAVAPRPVLLKEWIVGPVRRTLWILMGTVAFVLLIACANIANLFLVRTEARQRETAVRRALGASRGQVLRGLFAEGMVLASLGGAAGVLLASAGLRLLVRSIPFPVPRIEQVGIDGTVLGFAALLALGCGVVFACLPTFRGSGELTDALRDGGARSTAGAVGVRTRQSLVIAQIALSLVLLSGAGLMARSFARLAAVDPGFDPEGLLTFRLSLPATRYTPEQAVAFHDALLERLAALPGVASVGAARELPFGGRSDGDALIRQDDPPAEGEVRPIVWVTRATPSYFATMRVPLLAGRGLTGADQHEVRPVILLNQAAADTFFPGEDPVGKRVRMGGDKEDPRWLEIIGVVGTTKRESLREEPTPVAYVTTTEPQFNSVRQMGYALRVDGDPLALAATVRRLVREADAGLPIVALRSAEQIVTEAGAAMAFTMVLLGIASGVAVLLGSVGVYGVISYIVALRTGEIGIRMALGAAGDDVRAMLLRQGAVVGALGLALGAVATLSLSRALESALYEIDPLDPSTHAATAALMFAIVLFATWLPARRASRIEPVAALRDS